ncbi:MAG TPA: MoxR family ATPase [Burkholderiales bacterium]|nr:MoxR family ATPase [Burkholderiales bacterium]
MAGLPKSIDETLAALRAQDYIAERRLATALFLALRMERPLFLEGETGVGKTEVAKALARALGRRLIRLQCYEGLDVASAVYEWNYPRQMLEIRLAEAAGRIDGGEGSPSKRRAERSPRAGRDALGKGIFSEKFLIERPILQALRGGAAPPVLLIDELDRADEPFEAYLLEVLSDWQVSIPEIGTVRAERPPIVIVTSNRTREIHDAVKRRCLYHWIDYPDAHREFEIVRSRAPEAPAALSRQVVAFVQKLRSMDLFKPPGIAETIDWARALAALDAAALEAETVDGTLGALLKYQDDLARVRGAEAAALVQRVKAELAV